MSKFCRTWQSFCHFHKKYVIEWWVPHVRYSTYFFWFNKAELWAAAPEAATIANHYQTNADLALAHTSWATTFGSTALLSGWIFSGVWKHEKRMIWLEMFNPALHSSWLKSFKIRTALINVWSDAFAHLSDWWIFLLVFLEQMVKKMRSFNSKSTCGKMADFLPKTTIFSWVDNMMAPVQRQHWICGRNRIVMMRKLVTSWSSEDVATGENRPLSVIPDLSLFLSFSDLSLQLLRKMALIKDLLGEKKRRKWQSIFLILWPWANF